MSEASPQSSEVPASGTAEGDGAVPAGRGGRLLHRLTVALVLFGGLGFAVAILVTCWSAIGKGLFRLLNSLFGADAVPQALAWLRPLNGEDELVAFGVGFALYAAAPYLMLTRGHITVDLFARRFGPALNRVLVFFGDLLFLIAGWMIFAQQWNLIFKPARTSRGQEPLLNVVLSGDWATVGKRFRDSQETQVLGLEFWPMHIWAELCTGLFVIAALYCTVQSGRAVIAGWRQADAASGSPDLSAPANRKAGHEDPARESVSDD